jgi:hypothetical protein
MFAIKRALAAIAAVTALGSVGCYKATFISSPNAVRGEEHSTWNSFFLWGLVGSDEVDVKEFCPNGRVASIQTGQNVANWFLAGITFGIYSPRRTLIHCDASGGAAPAAASAGRKVALLGDENGNPVAVAVEVDGEWQAAKVTKVADGGWLVSRAEVR